MTTLFTNAEAAAATLGAASRDFAITGLSIDTRTIKPGDLFVALAGNRDGHDFVADALAAGASAALVSKTPPGAAADAPLLTVAHTQRGLEDLARAARNRSAAKIIGVTGSAGKTTTKEMLRAALNALGPTHASAASYNNHWGVPLSLAQLARDHAYGVFEIGMNHFGEIRALTNMVRPHAAIVTTIAPAHLEFFGNCDAIADAKSEIFEELAPGGAAILPADSPYHGRLLARARQAHVARILSFGNSGADARLLSAEPDGGGTRIEADIMGTRVTAYLAVPGLHIAQNAVAVLAAVAAIDGDVPNAAAALRHFSALKGRGARFTAGGIHVIDESYNANPASMAAALALLGAAKGRRIAVLGDMLEMGEGSAAHHAALAGPIDAAGTDLVFAAGPAMRHLWDALPAARRGAYAQTSALLLAQLTQALKSGDTVLVKGSNGARMNLVVEALQKRES